MKNLVVVMAEDGQHFQVFRHDGASAPVEVTKEYRITWGRTEAADAKDGEVLFGFHVGKIIPASTLVVASEMPPVGST